MLVTHRRVLLSTLPLLLLAFARPACCQEDASARGAVAGAPVVPVLDDVTAEVIINEGINHSQAMKLLRGLTSIGHRLTGSDNFTKACNWTLSEFQRMGLEAHLEKWAEWKLVWNRGAWIGRVVSEPQVDMYVATEAWTAGTKGLQRGKLQRMPKDEAEFDARKDQLAGTFLYRAGAFPTREPQREEDKEAYHKLMELKERCHQQGILGWVYGAQGSAAYPTRVRVFGEHLTAMKTMADVPTVPEIAVRSDHAKDLVRRMDGGKEVVVEFDIQNTFREGPIVLNNVIAELKGTEKPDEFVIISSHLDSWHQATGTTDNGTGTNSNMEAARILAAVGAKPKRTIRFCLWGGEEEGLLGSAAYVKQHRSEMNNISCAFNHDTGTNWAQGITVTTGMYEPMRRVMAPVMRMKPPDADWDGPVFSLRSTERIGGGRGGSDNASFNAAGVPGLNWNLQGRSDYFEYTWHSQWDTIDVAIEEYQRHTATVIALAALGVANLPELLDHSGVNRGGASTPQGVTMVNGAFDVELDGLKFAKVNAGGRGDKMGILPGDVLQEINGKDIKDAFEIFSALRVEPAPQELVFTLKRGDGTVEARVKTADLPGMQQQGRGGRGGGGRGGPAGGRMLFESDMEGLKFSKVDKDGRGDKMGFLEGDVIQKVNGKEVTAPEDIFRVLREDPAPAELVFTVQRGDSTAEVKVKSADLNAGRRGRGGEEAPQGARRGG